MEMSEEIEGSKMSNSHIDLRDDLKSIKSYKSKGSIKSEVQPDHIDQNKLKNHINTFNNSKMEDSDEESEQSSHMHGERGHEVADIISHKSYKSIKSMKEKNKSKNQTSIMVPDID